MATQSPAGPAQEGTVYEDLGARDGRGEQGLQPGDPGFFFPTWLLEERQTIPVFCMAWWGLSILITLINYVVWVRTEEADELYGSDVRRAYVAFVVLGMVCYLTVASTLWLWASRYAATRVTRKRRTILGIVVLWFFNDMPLWALDYTIVSNDARRGIQVASMVFNTLSFLGGGIVVWLTYTYKVTTFLNLNYTPPARPPQSTAHSGSVFPERGGGVSASPMRGLMTHPTSYNPTGNLSFNSPYPAQPAHYYDSPPTRSPPTQSLSPPPRGNYAAPSYPAYDV